MWCSSESSSRSPSVPFFLYLQNRWYYLFLFVALFGSNKPFVEIMKYWRRLTSIELHENMDHTKKVAMHALTFLMKLQLIQLNYKHYIELHKNYSTTNYSETLAVCQNVWNKKKSTFILVEIKTLLFKSVLILWAVCGSPTWSLHQTQLNKCLI